MFCAFFLFLGWKEGKKKSKICYTASWLQYPHPLFMLSSPPRPHPLFIKGKNKYTISRKCQWKYFFYSCLSVSVVSSSASACVLSSLTLVSCSFMLYVFTGLFFAHVCLYAPFPPPHHHVLCPFLSFRTLCAFLCLFSLFAGTVCWGWAVLSVHPVWLVSGTTLNLMI